MRIITIHKYNCCLLLTLLLGAGLISTAKGDLTLFDTYKSTPENTPHIVSVASEIFAAPDLTNLLRLEEGTLAPVESGFTITYLVDKTAEVSWDLTGSGFNLLGIYVFGGSNGANLYKVTDAEQMISGSAIIHTPVTGNSGEFADISHALFLGVPEAVIPEPSTLGLMVGGVMLLAAAQRVLRRGRR